MERPFLSRNWECVGRPSDLPRPRGPVPKFIEIVYFVKSADKSIRIGAAPVVLLYLLLLPPQLLNFRIVLRSITLFWPWLGDGIESNLIEMKAVVVR
jgi:hypothetical protein